MLLDEGLPKEDVRVRRLGIANYIRTALFRYVNGSKVSIMIRAVISIKWSVGAVVFKRAKIPRLVMGASLHS